MASLCFKKLHFVCLPFGMCADIECDQLFDGVHFMAVRLFVHGLFL